MRVGMTREGLPWDMYQAPGKLSISTRRVSPYPRPDELPRSGRGRSRVVRPAGYVVRYGGEQFMVIKPETEAGERRFGSRGHPQESP